MWALTGQLYAAVLKFMGIILTLVLLSIWKVSGSPYLESKCYECFNAFNFLCMQLDQNIYEGLIDEVRINFIGSDRKSTRLNSSHT